MKPELEILKKIESDMDFLKSRVIRMEDEIKDISSSFYDVKPAYIKKLEKIQKSAKFTRFKDVISLRKAIENA